MDLHGQTALVTGASGGIGRAIVEELAKQPLGLLLAGARDPDRFEPPTAPPGGAREVRAARLDLASKDSIQRDCDALSELTQIDLLVNNAGRFVGGLLEGQDLDAVYDMVQVNLLAPIHLTQRVLPGMVKRRRGMVVNNTSISGYAFFPAASTYSASKAGLVAFSESLRRELHGTGVGVLHLVTPGVDTEMLDATKDVYRRHGLPVGGWDQETPAEWAAKVVGAIRADDHVLGPGGRTALAKLASRGPAFVLDAVLNRSFKREPR